MLVKTIFRWAVTEFGGGLTFPQNGYSVSRLQVSLLGKMIQASLDLRRIFEFFLEKNILSVVTIELYRSSSII